jgi:hypothetical protein
MLRAPAFISQRWKSMTGSLGRDGPRPPPDWPLPPVLGWPLLVLGLLLGLLLGWPLLSLGWPLPLLGWPLLLLLGGPLPSGWPSPRDSDT